MSASSIEHTLWITQKINVLFGLSPDPPVIPDHIVESIIIFGALSTFAIIARRNLSMVPNRLQNVIEMALEAIHNLLESVIGPKGPRYFPVIASMALFILFGNLIGLVPFCKSPTSNLNVTLACAIIVFVYYHFVGIREQGFVRYMSHFAGPKPFLAPLMFPLEIISHFARVMSLAIRLFGNIMGEDIIIIILFILVPYIVPIPMMLFAIFTSVLQSFIFIMLSMMYIAGAVAEESHDAHAH